MSIKDSHVTIMVKDMAKSISFYQSIGFTTKNRWGNHYTKLTAPGITIGFHPSTESSTGSGNVSIGFATENFEQTRSLSGSLSIYSVERDEEGGQFIHFHDPDGTLLYFIRPKWG